MKGKRFTDEQIVPSLRDANTTSITATARKHGVPERSIHRWRMRLAGIMVSNVRELCRLRDKNARLNSLVARRDLKVEVIKKIQAKR